MKNLLIKAVFLLLIIPSLSFSASKDVSRTERVGSTTGKVTRTPPTKHPYLRGGGIIEGHKGLVRVRAQGARCTGSMVANNIIITAAHCLKNVGVEGQSEGEGNFIIDYFDPQGGERRVYSGNARWYVPTAYNANAEINTGYANSDIALIRTNRNFTRTDSSDYLVIYDDSGTHLKPVLNAYGAGIYTYSGKSDGKLRGNWFEVENVKENHIVVDTRKKVGLCKGDSGGPLVYIPNTSSPIPMLAGVLSNSEIMYSDQVCTNNSWGHDDAKYSRANWGKISRLFSKANITCSKESSSGISYRKCFSGNVSEPTKLTFDCRIQGSNKGCKKIISCPAGTKIVSAKATCNLEHGSVKDSDLNNTKYGRIKVIRESDNMKAGLCRIGKTKKRKKGSKVFNTKGIIGQSSTQIFCKEHDKNGGDCHIKASLACF